MTVALAHALPQSVGAVPLTLVLTILLAAFLGVNALTTRRAAVRVAEPARVGGGGEGPASSGRDGIPDVLGEPVQMNPLGTVIGLVLGTVTVLLSVAGPTDPASNLTDVVVLSLGWGLIALMSILAGPWWLAINPVNALSGALERAAGGGQPRRLGGSAGTVVTVALLLGWAAAQLLVDFGPAGFAILVLVHLVGHALAAGTFGPSWLAIEPTNVLTTTMGLLRPGGGGPLRRLSEMAADDRLGWVAATLIGWSLGDLLLETEWWHDLGLRSAAILPVGLAVLTSVVVILGMLIRTSSRRVGLTPAFVAVAGGWIVAHYLSILLIEGQGIPIWLSDPLGSGADLLGQRDSMVNLEPLPTPITTALQLIPFLAGHVLAIAVIQRRAASRVRQAAQLGPATLEARALVGVLLLGGAWLQLAGL